MISSSAFPQHAWVPRAFPAALFRLCPHLGRRDAGGRGKPGFSPAMSARGTPVRRHLRSAPCGRFPSPSPAGRFPRRGRGVVRPRRPLTGASPLPFTGPCPPLRGGRGAPGGPRCLLGFVVRAAAAAAGPARPGTTVPTWPCGPAHERSGAVAHLLYCLAEDKKKSNWRDCKANVAGAAGAK